MNIQIIAAASVSLLLSVASGAASAQVVAVDLNGDGHSFAFLDVANGLYWSRPDVIAAAGYASATSAIGSLELEGRTNWRLPMKAEFQALYATQGQTGTAMRTAPFPAYLGLYWTTDVNVDNTLQNVTFAPGNGTTQPRFRTTAVGVWAVSPVPEPSAGIMAALGAAALLLRMRPRFRQDCLSRGTAATPR